MRYRRKLCYTDVKYKLFTVSKREAPELYSALPSPGSRFKISDETGREYAVKRHSSGSRVDGLAEWYKAHPRVGEGDLVTLELKGEDLCLYPSDGLVLAAFMEAPPEGLVEAAEPTEHTKIQFMLLKIGRTRRFEVWACRRDHTRRYDNQEVGDLSIQNMHKFTGQENVNRTAAEIDVIWFDAHQVPKKFFEVEATTSIYSGLLRLNDLKIMYPVNECFIVAPKDRLEKFNREVDRPTFSDLRSACHFISFDDVESVYTIEVSKPKPRF